MDYCAGKLGFSGASGEVWIGGAGAGLFFLSNNSLITTIGIQPLIIIKVPGNPPMFLPTMGSSAAKMSPRNASQMPNATAIATAEINAVFWPNFL